MFASVCVAVFVQKEQANKLNPSTHAQHSHTHTHTQTHIAYKALKLYVFDLMTQAFTRQMGFSFFFGHAKNVFFKSRAFGILNFIKQQQKKHLVECPLL